MRIDVHREGEVWQISWRDPFFSTPTINILVLFWIAHTSISSKLGMPLGPQRYILLYGKYVDIITFSMIGMAKEFGDLVKVYIY